MPSHAASMIAVHKLVKRFGLKTVLRGMEFQVQPGEFVALLGPNGAGKTTFLRILSSLSRPTLGEVSIAGYSLPGQASAVRSRLGVVSHLPLLYGDLTAEENLEFYGRMYGVVELESRSAEVLDLVGLSARRRDLVRTYSRGMQQRLAIGRAVLHDPDVLLLDEPHTGLDQDACEMLDRALREVAARAHGSDDLSRFSPRRRPGDPLRRALPRRDHRLGAARPDRGRRFAGLLPPRPAGGLNGEQRDPAGSR